MTCTCNNSEPDVHGMSLEKSSVEHKKCKSIWKNTEQLLKVEPAKPVLPVIDSQRPSDILSAQPCSSDHLEADNA